MNRDREKRDVKVKNYMLWLCVFALWRTVCADAFDVPLDAGTTLPVERYVAQGDALLLWLPSEYGMPSNVGTIASQLARSGIETWSADVFAAYFLPASSPSVGKIPDAAIATLIKHARVQTKKHIYLLGNDKGADLALRGARRWQLDHTRDDGLDGVVLISPNLLVQIPEAGRDAEYLPIASATNLSLFVLQPVLSPHYWRLRATTQQLERGGSRVYTRTLAEVRDRFFFRPDLLPAEQRVTEQLPSLIAQAIKLLAQGRAARTAVATVAWAPTVPDEPQEKRLRAYAGDPQPPPLALTDLTGGARDLAHARGRVVLVNFWATWCPPCVHEMPSMQRLKETLRGQPFEILAVNMAEEKSAVTEFARRFALDFDVLLDRDGAALKAWKVMAFPTSFVIDKHGKIRYALFGAVDWMEQDTLATLDQLLREK